MSMAKNKFGARQIKDPATGFVFDSKAEFIRWCELRILERAGKISNLQRQVKYVLIPAQYERYERYSDKTGKKLKDGLRCLEKETSYYADFVYERDGKTVVEDVKGYKKGAAYDLFVIKRKLMMQVYGIKIQEVKV